MPIAPNLDIAWTASVAVVAGAYGVDPALIAAPTRGRGPRPPAAVWQAKKMAVHLAVIIADQGYAPLAAHIGMHRDTVASHCADMREAADLDRDLDDLSLGLERAVRLRAAAEVLTPVEVAASDPLDQLLGALRGYAESLIRQSSDKTPLHPTKRPPHGNVIALGGTSRRRA